MSQINYWFTYKEVVYSPCPHASWTIWCPCLGTGECLKCPVYRNREKGTVTYVVPEGTGMTIEVKQP